MKPNIERVENFPFKYFQYGSESSTDIDVIIQISSNEMPITQEERKRKLKQLMLDFNLNWNAIFAVIQKGVIRDTIYTKSWVDSLNNALYNTYGYHNQLFPNPITKTLKRNKTLAIYKAVRTVLTLLTRTPLRTEIKPILKGVHPFKEKLSCFEKLDFSKINTFNQKNTKDTDIWKIIAFYMAQNELLLSNNIEVYTKESVMTHFSFLSNFILRKKVANQDKIELTHFKNKWVKTIKDYGVFSSEQNKLYCNNEVIDMMKEKSL